MCEVIDYMKVCMTFDREGDYLLLYRVTLQINITYRLLKINPRFREYYIKKKNFQKA